MNKTFNPCDGCEYSFSKQNQESGMCKICEFKKMLDLEEQGKLLKLPCTVGDWVYKIKDGWVDSYKVVRIEVDGNKESDVYFKSSFAPEKWPFCTLDDFGKTVFLASEEAEAALKNQNIKGNQDD